MKYQNMLSSVVVVGQMNPAILSHAFLDRNGILPPALKENIPTPTITPVLSILEYENQLKVVVEQPRMVVQSTIIDALPLLSQFVKKYFDILQFTPLEAIGINFHGRVILENDKELQLLLHRLKPAEIAPPFFEGQTPCDWQAGIRYLFENFRMTISFDWITPGKMEFGVLANFHRDLKESKESVHTHLKEALDKMPYLLDKFQKLLCWWLTEERS